MAVMLVLNKLNVSLAMQTKLSDAPSQVAGARRVQPAKSNQKFPAVGEIRYLGRFSFGELQTQSIRFVIISAIEWRWFHRFITFSLAARGQNSRPPLTRPLRIFVSGGYLGRIKSYLNRN